MIKALQTQLTDTYIAPFQQYSDDQLLNLYFVGLAIKKEFRVRVTVGELRDQLNKQFVAEEDEICWHGVLLKTRDYGYIHLTLASGGSSLELRSTRIEVVTSEIEERDIRSMCDYLFK